MAAGSGYHVFTIWAWRDEGPELLDAWDEFSVDANDEGWREAQTKANAMVQKEGSGFWREAGIRVFKLTIPYPEIEDAFMPAAIESQMEKGFEEHPLVAFVQRVESWDDPSNAEAQRDRQSVNMSQIIDAAKAALDASAERMASDA